MVCVYVSLWKLVRQGGVYVTKEVGLRRMGKNEPQAAHQEAQVRAPPVCVLMPQLRPQRLQLHRRKVDSTKRTPQLLMELNHPNIVRCHEAFVADGTLCIVMDHCSEGEQ